MAVANTRVVNGINTRVLHNKDYVEVSERTRILHELRKAGEIKEFEMVDSQPYEIANRLVWRASARIDGKLYIGNAEVKLDAPKGSPDGTNPFECAETSAFGRMLAFAGLGTVESIASYEEVMRGQPFTAIIEQSQQNVVEASNVRQIPAPTTRPQTPPAENKAPGDTFDVKSALDSLYTRAKEMGIVSDLVDWQKLKCDAFGKMVPDEAITEKAQCEQIRVEIVKRKGAKKAPVATSGK